MLMDERLEFADDVALATTGPATVLLGDVIDTSVIRDLGHSKMHVVIQVTTAITNADDGTVEFSLVSDAAAAIAVDGSASVHGKTGALAKAATPAGAQFVIPLPHEGSVPYERYLGVLVTDAGHAITAGKVNAFLTDQVPAWKGYKAAGM